MSDAAGRHCPSCHKPLPAEAVFCLHCGARTPTEPGVPPRTAPTGAHEISRLSRAIADRYRIERVLGEGGMATVYLAEDLKHHRRVAVKVMRPELAETLGADRFLREIEIAARLSHPHILPVFDSGQSEGFLWYVMPYVEGESLPARLAREKQLPAVEALRIAREVAEALGFAHERGIVHRDIKPANILLTAGHALVADFGIARATAGQGESLTKTGLAIGTPQYMSPEQAGGDSTIDGRSDIYSLGCVLYEMLAGEPPFSGPTAQAVIARAMSESARPLETTRQGLAPVVTPMVVKALSKSAADRFQTAGEFAAAIARAEDQTRSGTQPLAAGAVVSRPTPAWRRWALAAAAVVVIGALAAGAFKLGIGSSGPAGVQRLAILPFENQGRTEDAYFADGIVDEVRGKLARLGNLSVIASTSVNQYRGSTKSVNEIARELGADYLLVGKVRWLEQTGATRRVQVVTELVDGRSGATTWQDSFDGQLTDVFQMQATMASRVAGALGTALGADDQQHLAERPTSNAAAYDFFLKGRAISDNGAAPQREAAGYFEQAVALDASFADAWAGLAGSLSNVYANGNREPNVARRAREAALRSLSITPEGRLPLISYSRYLTLVESRLDSAAVIAARVLALAPNDAEVLAMTGRLDASRGHTDSAVARLERARRLDPRSNLVLGALLSALVQVEQFERAKPIGHDAIALTPDDLQATQFLVDAYLGTGDLDGAKTVLQGALAQLPPTQVVTYFAGYNEQSWLFEEKEYALLMRLTPAAFDNDRAWWGQALAIAAHQRGDTARARVYADSSLDTSREQAETNPMDDQLAVLYGVALALSGHSDAALRQGDIAVGLSKRVGSQNATYVLLQKARIEIIVGRYDDAIASLRQSRASLYPSKGRLRLDPTFAPLRGKPGFEALVRAD